MIRYRNRAERDALIDTLREGYMEVFPTDTIEDRMSVLQRRAYVAVTCSPTRGVDETLDMTERLSARGFRVVPHLAAKMVRDRRHLREIMARLNGLPVDSIFVPGGDAARPLGEYSTAFELLRDIAGFDHAFAEVGIAAHPEGHPEVDCDALTRELERKQPLATYLVTQMCFDARALEDWLREIRGRGITLPAWIGIPGQSDRTALLKTSLRIGVGDSLRFLSRRGGMAAKLMKSGSYSPDDLLSELAPSLVDHELDIAGCHIFCFNLVERTEAWRHRTLATLFEAAAAGS